MTLTTRKLLLVTTAEEQQKINGFLQQIPSIDFFVKIAADTNIALELLSLEKFDCVLVRANLNEIDDSEFLSNIVKEFGLSAVPVVVISDEESMEQVLKFTKSEVAQDYLTKGKFDKTDLLRAIENAVEKAQLRRNNKQILNKYTHQSSIIEFSDDAIIGKTLEGIITSWNKGAEKIYGYTEAEIIGRSISILIPENHPDELPEILKKIGQGERVDHFETKRLNKQGEFLDISLTVSPVKNAAGEIVGASAIARNITEQKRAGKLLLESNQNFQALVRASSQYIWTVGSDNQGYDRDNWWFDLTGQKLDELDEWGWLESIHPDDRENLRTEWSYSLENKSIFYVEYRIKNKSGVYQNFAVRGVPVYNDDGSFRQWFGTLTDITEKKNAEENLRESQRHFRELSERLRLFVEFAPAAVAMFDREMNYIAVSRRWIQDFGLENDIIGKNHYEIFPEISESWKEIHKRSLAGSVEKNDKDKFVRQDGSVTWLKWEVRPWSDSLGQIGGIIIFSEDITERIVIEENLRFEKERFDKIASVAPSLISSLNISADGKVTFPYTSPAVEDIYGFTSEQIREDGQQIFDLVHPDDIERINESISKSMQEMSSWHETFRYIHPVKGEVWIEGYASPIKEDDGGITWHGIIIDATDRKNAEKDLANIEAQLRQSQKLESIGQLAGGIAHDFNNILTVINGYSALAMIQLEKKDPLQKRLEEINNAGSRAAALTQQLLAFSRKQILQPKIINVNSIIQNFEKMLRRLIGEHIEFNTVLDPNIGNIKADPGQIEQVIMNLVVNSRDAMPNGGTLTIETQNIYLDEKFTSRHISTDPGSYLMIAVSDSGIGMDKETLDKIFDPFFTTKKLGEGTGLGLATVYGIVKQSGGNIWVYSEPERGTTFKVYFPMEEIFELSPNNTGSAEKALEGNETIILTEDEEMVRKLTREVLESYGYRVLEAENPEQAIAICEAFSEKIDLLITDVVMPKMNGAELSKKLQQDRPQLKVLYISGYTDNTIVHHGVLDEGINFIQKPFSPKKLAQKIREIFEEN